jgi:hypothetical protein
MSTTNDCAVCCMPFNKTTRSRVLCACSYEACKTCVQTYLLGSTSEPNCMSCSTAWSDTFLSSSVNSSFIKTKYKEHRKELLVQQEISRIPESMAAAETYKRIYDINKQIDTLHLMNNKLKAERAEIIAKHSLSDKKVYQRYVEIRDTQYTIRNNIKSMRHDIAVIRDGGQPGAEAGPEGDATQEKAKKEKKKFIMPCPGTDCRGYLTSEYKCEMCEESTCEKCLEIIDTNTAHDCKKENIESAEFIRSQSKPCPCCGARISKIDGCDQMWCTQCHKAFSWNSGRIITGKIHNPHYYQYQRETGGGTAPREAGDVLCGGLCDISELIRVLKAKLNDSKTQPNGKEHDVIREELINIHRQVVHITMVNLGQLRRQLGEEVNNEQERLKYIVKETTREELASAIIHKDYKRRKDTDLLHVCELFVTVSTDIFNVIVRSEKKGPSCIEEIRRCLTELRALMDYTNGQFKQISITYGICVPIVSVDASFESIKYNSKGETDSYIIKREEKQAKRKEVRELEWKQREEHYRLRREEAQKAQEQKEQAIKDADLLTKALEQVKL